MARSVQSPQPAEPDSLEGDAVSTRFRLRVIGKYESQGKHEPQITVNLSSGDGDHFVHSGTFTMSESEWTTLIGALEAGIPGDVEVEDARHLLSEVEMPEGRSTIKRTA